MSLFNEYIIEPVKDGLENPNKGIPIPMTKLSKYTNHIERGQYTVIGGKPTSGKSALMDYIYMINVYKWWRSKGYDDTGSKIKYPDRPPLKMFYFNMKTKPHVKWQKWVCLYLKLEHGLVIDIPTLTGKVGKLYELDQIIVDQITKAREFFEEFEAEVMTVIHKPQQPSSIFNRIYEYMLTIGHIDQSGKYTLDAEYEGQLVYVYIDNTRYLVSESDGFQTMDEKGLNKKINAYAITLSKDFNVNINIIIPNRTTVMNRVKESEPTYKELGVFAESADLGLITYNPYNENNNKFLGYPVEATVIRGKHRLRTITVVRNPIGLENVTVGAFFLGECGYFTEAPHPTQEEDFDNVLGLLEALP